jgi:hypothetical protein
MDRLRRLLPDENSTLEAGVAALAGFLAGYAVHGEWPLPERILAVLFGT